jgi:hypothetical protein
VAAPVETLVDRGSERALKRDQLCGQRAFGVEPTGVPSGTALATDDQAMLDAAVVRA